MVGFIQNTNVMPSTQQEVLDLSWQITHLSIHC